MLPSSRETAYALYATWRLAFGDRSALNHFNNSVQGFWNSFFAAVIIAPAFAIQVLSSERAIGAEPVSIAIVLTLAYVIAWVGFPLLMYYLCDQIGRGQRYIRFVVAYNWAAVLQTAVLLPAHVASNADVVAPALLALGALVSFATLAYRTFIVHAALEVRVLPALGIVLIEEIVIWTTLESAYRAL